MLMEHYASLSAENRKRKTAHPEAGGHNLPHFQMMQNHILDALRRLPRERSENFTAVVFGAKECNDIPLEALVGWGDVYLIDVDPESVETARNRLQDALLRKRVHPVCMDVSLFETVLIHRVRKVLERHASDIHRAFNAVVSLHREAADTLRGSSAGSSLPLGDGGADLLISTMTLSQFLVGYVQVLLKLFLESCGREKTQTYFLKEEQHTGGEEKEPHPMTLLQRSTLLLSRRAAAAHVRELCRIVKSKGVVVLADHALHGRGIVGPDTGVDVETRSLGPYSKNDGEEKRLWKTRMPNDQLPGTLRVEDSTQPDETCTLEGMDTLKNILSREPRAEPLKEQRWWWLTERAEGSEPGRAAWHLSYVETHTFRTR